MEFTSMLSPQQQTAFFEASNRILGKDRLREGIGTLSEKTTHAILKHYYSPDSSCHEIPICGCVADIFTGEEIFEIQTANFQSLRKKLDLFLPVLPVSVVYPIPYRKWIAWIDPATGEQISNRRSPKTGCAEECFRELYKIRPYLRHPNLRIRLALLDVQEYRLLDGWSRDKKKGAHRFDRIPLNFYDEIILAQPLDYMQLLPLTLPDPFTAADYARHTKISRSTAQTGLLLLSELGVVRRDGRQRQSYLYRVAEITGKSSAFML